MTLLNQTIVPWQMDPSLGTIPESFKYFQNTYLTSLGKTVSMIAREPESSGYAAVRFVLDGQTCLFRQAKHTPKKIGQFVTLWKRPTPNSEIAPFDVEDGIDRVIVFADVQERFGVFVFDPKLLAQKDVFSVRADGGKRAFRVYAPWTVPVAAQAKRSKKWQCLRFVELTQSVIGLTRLAQALL